MGADIIVIGIIVVALGFAARAVYKTRKAGGCSGCSGCSHKDGCHKH